MLIQSLYRVFLFLALALAGWPAFAVESNYQELPVDVGIATNDLRKVRFINGVRLQTSNQKGEYGLFLTTPANRKPKDLSDFLYAEINLAYPSKNNAILAIVSRYCVGSACPPPQYSLYVTQGDSLREYDVTGVKSLALTLVGNRIEKMTALGHPDGEDPYGNPVFADYTWIDQEGFKPQTDIEWRLSWEHRYPFTMFMHPRFQKELAQQTGFTQFRTLRRHSGTASAIRLINQRYLILSGCLPHYCSDFQALVIADVLTGVFWWVSTGKDSEDNFSGGPSVLTMSPQSRQQFLGAIEHLELGPNLRVVVDSKGQLQIDLR